jgi:hypothetical protein
MSTFSPERVLTRPASGRPLWKEGWLAAALWLLGGLFTLAWPDAGRRWPFSEGWALAQFTLGGGLLLLALSYRYWRQRGLACSMPESGWRCCRCFCAVGGTDGQDGVSAGAVFRAAAGAD